MILVGDIGGTRTRLALAERDGAYWRLGRLEDHPTTADVPGAIGRFLAREAAPRPVAAAFCGAGPVGADGRIRLTNTDVLLEPDALARAAGVSEALLVNDFHAVARSIPALGSDSLTPIGGGDPVSGAPRVVLGPGTGLGVAILSQVAGEWFPIDGEGGHVDLAPVDDEELEAWQRLRKRHRRVSAETVLCGPGLERLHAALSGGEPRRVADIDAAARAGDPAARRTIAVFTRWLGRVAGDLALIAGAEGGVFLAGGILPRWKELFDPAEFRRGLEDKPPHGARLAAIPCWLVTHPQPGLLGLAELAGAA